MPWTLSNVAQAREAARCAGSATREPAKNAQPGLSVCDQGVRSGQRVQPGPSAQMDLSASEDQSVRGGPAAQTGLSMCDQSVRTAQGALIDLSV